MAELRREISWLLGFPDEGRGWISKAASVASRVARETGATSILSSGPPHSAHLAGAAAAWRARVPHIVDLRDPWATHRYDLALWGGVRARRVGKVLLPRMERFVLGRAARVVATTRRLRELLQPAYGSTRIDWIPNGVDLEEVEGHRQRPSYPGLSIAYAGTLYGGRSLEKVMEAFAEFLARHPDARSAGSRIRVAGHMNSTRAAEFQQQRRRFNLEDVVEHLGVVSRGQALEMTRASSISLVLAQAQELQVPGKIYEMAVLDSSSVLVISEADSASADEAARLGLPWAAPDDVEALLDIFDRAWAGHLQRPHDIVGQVSYQSIARDIEALIDDVSANSRSGPPSG